MTTRQKEQIETYRSAARQALDELAYTTRKTARVRTLLRRHIDGDRPAVDEFVSASNDIIEAQEHIGDVRTALQMILSDDTLKETDR